MRAPEQVQELRAVPRPSVDLDAEADLTRCGALKDYWYVACRSEELPPGRPIARRMFGTPLVLFRDAAGAPVALFDRCLHRNAPLSAGQVFDGKLGCAYHGWTYDRTGACVGVPSMGPGAPACNTRRLRRFETREQDGLVFVLPAPEGTPARAEPFRIPHADEPGWCVYFMVTRFANGVGPLVENFMDVPHTAFVHRGWFRNPRRREVPATVERAGGSVLVTYQEDRQALTGLGRIFNPRRLQMVHTDRFVSPNVTRVDYLFGDSGFAITSQCTPIGPTDTLVYTAISYRLPVDLPRALVARALMPLVRWYTRRVIVQDVEIMEIQRQGLTHAAGGGVFENTPADLHHTDIEAYRGWLLAGARGAGPPDAKREISFWV